MNLFLKEEIYYNYFYINKEKLFTLLFYKKIKCKIYLLNKR